MSVARLTTQSSRRRAGLRSKAAAKGHRPAGLGGGGAPSKAEATGLLTVEETVVVDWGDGARSEATTQEAGGASVAHTCIEPGEFEITVTVRDDDGGTGERKVTESVKPQDETSP